MKAGRISDADFAEFEKLGEEYDAAQQQVSEILVDPSRDLSLEELTRLHDLTKLQNEIHHKRMALIRYEIN